MNDGKLYMTTLCRVQMDYVLGKVKALGGKSYKHDD